MRGQGSRIYSGSELQPLYRGSLNSYSAISELGLTQDNFANVQATANTTLDANVTPNGLLAGSVAGIVGAAEVGAATSEAAGAETNTPVGIVVRDAAGEAYESTSSIASGSITYLQGSNSLVEVPAYETVATDGTTALTYAAGAKLYASQNGLLTVAAGLIGGAAGADLTVVAVVVEPPVTSAPGMVVQLRI